MPGLWQAAVWRTVRGGRLGGRDVAAAVTASVMSKSTASVSSASRRRTTRPRAVPAVVATAPGIFITFVTALFCHNFFGSVGNCRKRCKATTYVVVKIRLVMGFGLFGYLLT